MPPELFLAAKLSTLEVLLVGALFWLLLATLHMRGHRGGGRR